MSWRKIVPWGRLVIAFLVIGLSAGGIYAKKSGALLPGPLSAVSGSNGPLGGFTSHAEFEQDCGHCHTPIHCISEDQCQTCHLEVARQRVDADGLHGRLPAGRCNTCHTEHKGREAHISTFAFENIDHERLAGFSLLRHQKNYQDKPLDCSSCHPKDRFLQENLDCTTCHMQADPEMMSLHLEAYGFRCLECHDGTGRMQAFDHQAGFTLAGQHQNIICQDCHPENIYVGIPSNCFDCHTEPVVHSGLFGTDCDRCHDAFAWRPAQLTQHTFQLDHGGVPAACEDCHPGSYTEYLCDTCHEHRPEKLGQVHKTSEWADGGPCGSCHVTGRPEDLSQPGYGTPSGEDKPEPEEKDESGPPEEPGRRNGGFAPADEHGH